MGIALGSLLTKSSFFVLKNRAVTGKLDCLPVVEFHIY